MSYQSHERQIQKSSHHAAQPSDEWVSKHGNELHISAKAMNIAWGNDTRFWRWVDLQTNNLGFKGGFELIQVCWLEVTGLLDLSKFILDPSKTYEILYVVKFNVDAFGWNTSPITFELATQGGFKSKRSEILEPYRKKVDQWHFIHGGEFRLPANMVHKVEFSFREVETNWWKGGLILEGVIIKSK